MSDHDPNWIAPRVGQDWRDPDVARAVNWLKSFVPRNEMDRRLDDARARLEDAFRVWREGGQAPLYDLRDAAAWYVLQGESFATDRRWTVPEDMARIVPALTRIGQELDQLTAIPGADLRAARLMRGECAQPDAGLYELLVALAYRRGEWSVEFTPEAPGVRRTPDLSVRRPRSRWAVECKRMAPSGYGRRERARAQDLAAPVHVWCRDRGRSLIVEVIFFVQLETVPDDYLLNTVTGVASGGPVAHWRDDAALGRVREVNWALARRVLAHDDVYFGSSRMIELLSGRYAHSALHSMAADWRPSRQRPAYASALDQASVVSCWSRSEEARNRTAQHFRRQVSDAEGQLPGDRPGVIHIGIEGAGDASAEARRHLFNMLEARYFDIRASRLRWAYANIFIPEATTRPNETWAMTETMIPYKIGAHSTRWPLPGHLLLTPEGEGREGVHWE